MKFRKHIRASGLVELICEHGCGHPDPESAQRVAEHYGHDVSVWLTHGCDGCCTHIAPEDILESKFDDDEVAIVMEMYDSGYDYSDIAEYLQCTVPHIQYLVRRS